MHRDTHLNPEKSYDTTKVKCIRLWL